MAHELFPFSLNLNSKDWQPIFSNQELGTFFVIYIKIHSTAAQNISPKAILYDYHVTFRIQNYRGAVTMGLIGTPSVDENTPTPEKNYNLRINLDIAPFSKKFESDPYIISVSKKLQRNFIIDSLGTVVKIPKTIEDIQNDIVNYIDPREYQRNGDTLDAVITIDDGERKKILDDISTYTKQNLIDKLQTILNKNGIGSDNGICCPRRSVVT